MKKPYEIPECLELFNEMFAEWDKNPRPKNIGFSWKREKEFEDLEKKYLPRIFEAYNKYKKEHPEEFKEEN